MRRLSPLAAIALGAFALRAVVVLTSPDYAVIDDVWDYDRYARSLAAGEGFPESLLPGAGPTAYRPPGFPLLLGGVYALTGDSVVAGRLVQAALGALAVWLIGLIALRLWGARVALIAAGIAAVLPTLVVTSTVIGAEALFVVLELAALLWLLRAEHGRDVAIAGALLGLAVLTRANGLVLLLPAVLAVRSPRRVLVLLTAAALVIAPWTIRNAVELSEFVPVSTQAGFTLVGTYNQRAADDTKFPGAWRSDAVFGALAVAHAKGARTEAEFDRELRGQALEYAGDHPGYPLAAGFWNTVRLLHLDGPDYAKADLASTGVPRWLAEVSAWTFILAALLAVVGLRSGARRRAPGWLWLVPLVLWTTVFVVAEIRFRAPIDPFVVLLAALGVDRLVRARAS